MQRLLLGSCIRGRLILIILTIIGNHAGLNLTRQFPRRFLEIASSSSGVMEPNFSTVPMLALYQFFDDIASDMP